MNAALEAERHIVSPEPIFPDSQRTLPCAGQCIPQTVLNDCIRQHPERLGRYKLAGADLRPSGDIVLHQLEILLRQCREDKSALQKIASLHVLVPNEFQKEFEHKITAFLDSVLEALPYSPTFAKDLVVLASFNSDQFRPSTQALTSTFDYLLDSCLELAELHHDAVGLGFKLNPAVLERRYRLIRGIGVAFGIEFDEYAKGAVIGSLNAAIIKSLGPLFGAPMSEWIADGELNLKLNNGEQVTLNDMEQRPCNPKRNIREVVKELALQLDLENLSVLKSKLGDDFVVERGARAEIYKKLSERADFGVRRKEGSTADFARCVDIFGVPDSLDGEAILKAKSRYIDPLAGHDVLDGEFRAVEEVLGISTAQKNSPTCAEHILASAIEQSGEALTLSQAVRFHFNRIATTSELKYLLHAFSKFENQLGPEEVVPLVSPYTRAEKRIGKTLAVPPPWVSASLLSIESRDIAAGVVLDGLEPQSTVGEFIGWAEKVQRGLSLPLTSSEYAAALQKRGVEDPVSYIREQIFRLVLCSIGHDSKETVDNIPKLEQILGEPFEVPSGLEPFLYVAALTPYLQDTDSFTDRAKIWDEAKKAVELIRRETGVAPPAEIVQEGYSLLFACHGVLREDYNAYKAIVGVDPSENTIQRTYAGLLLRYCSEESEFDADRAIDELERLTGVPPKVAAEKVILFAEWAKQTLDPSDERIVNLCKITGYEPDENFLTQFVFNDRKFNVESNFRVSHARLARHLEVAGAGSETRHFFEYLRMSNVFGYDTFYREQLAALHGRTDTQAVIASIRLNAIIGYCEGNSQLCGEEALEELMRIANLGQVELEKDLRIAFGLLAHKAPVHVFSRIISAFHEDQETNNNLLAAATKVFSAFANQQQFQDTMWHIIVTHDCEVVLPLLLGLMVQRMPAIFPSDLANRLHPTASKDGFHDYRDFRFYEEIRTINSLDHRRRAQCVFVEEILIAASEKRSFTELYENYRAIPKSVFVQVGMLTGWSHRYMEMFSRLFARTPSSTEREGLCSAITNACELPPPLKEVARELYFEGGMIDRADAALVQELFHGSACIFKAKLHRERKQSDKISKDEPQEQIDSANIAQPDSIPGLFRSEMLKLFSPFDVSEDQLRRIEVEWRELLPLLIYTTKISGHESAAPMATAARLIQNMDPPLYSGWKSWRYDLSKVQVQRQIGALNAEQRVLWCSDFALEVGGIDLSFKEGERGRKAVEILRGGIGQLSASNEATWSGARAVLTHTFDSLFEAADSGADVRDILTHSIAGIVSETSKPETAILYCNLPRLKDLIEKIKNEETFSVKAVAQGYLKVLDMYLSEGESKEIRAKVTRLKDSAAKRVSTVDLFSRETVSRLEFARDKISFDYAALVASGALPKPDAEISEKELLGRLHARYETLSSCKQILELVSAAFDLDGEQAESATLKVQRSLDALKHRFRKSDLAPHLRELDELLGVSALAGERRLGLLFTDNPEIILQIGKYPVGGGSCKHFEGLLENNIALLSDMHDAHIKIGLLVDMDKLPAAAQAAIRAGDPRHAALILKPQDVLSASVARTIFKCVVDRSLRPGVFIEETYTPFIDKTLEFERHFNEFAARHLGVGKAVYREGDDITVELPPSQSPVGQYEDRHNIKQPSRRMGIIKGRYQILAQSVVLEQDKQGHSTTVRNRGEPVEVQFSDGRILRTRFDLKTVVFEKFMPEALSQKNCHLVEVGRVGKIAASNPQEWLAQNGFFHVPSKVGYSLDVPQGAPDVAVEEYFSQFSGDTRRKRQREFRKIDGAIRSGAIELCFDRGEESGNMQSFMDLYEREMFGKARGWVPLLNAVEAEGGSPARFLRNDRLGIFLKRSGAVIGGLVARRSIKGYSISFSATDAALRSEIPQMGMFLNVELLKRSAEEGYRKVLYGADTNLYGHHLSTGLALAKVMQGYKPYAVGEKKFVRVVDPAPFDDPFFFFTLGLGGALEGALIFKRAPSKEDIDPFLRTSGKLNVYINNGAAVVPALVA